MVAKANRKSKVPAQSRRESSAQKSTHNPPRAAPGASRGKAVWLNTSPGIIQKQFLEDVKLYEHDYGTLCEEQRTVLRQWFFHGVMAVLPHLENGADNDPKVVASIQEELSAFFFLNMFGGMERSEE